MNGIVIESKYENEEEKKKMRARMMQSHPLLRPPFWLPQNITEYLFYSDDGQLVIHEEAVKALSYDFTTIMKGVYNDLREKYEDTIGAILQDAEFEGIDFPLVSQKVEITPLS